MSNSGSGLLTVRQIAAQLGETKSRVLYAIRRRGVLIAPAVRASQTMLFAPDVVPIVRAILKGMDANRDGAARFDGLDEKGGAR